MSLATQVMTRQQGHAQAVSSHLREYAELSTDDMGLVLQLLQPINQACVDVGCQVMSYSEQAFKLGAEKMSQSMQAYVEADKQTYEDFQEILAELGITSPPYTPPSTPTLGPAGDRATEQYSMPDGNLFHQAFWDGFQAAQWSQNTATTLNDRVSDGLSASRTVSEAVDASSFLTKPQVDDPEIENIRWKAGIIFGSIDWAFEAIFGYSLLEEVTKPFTGDWVRMKEAATAWTHTGDAVTAIGQNSSGMVPGLASWTGAGSEAFLVAAALVAKGHLALQSPTSTVSTTLKLLAALVKKVAGMIVGLLKKIQDRLLVIAAEAAVPIGGWVLSAATAAVTVAEIAAEVLDAYKKINMVYDFVSGAVSNVDQLLNSQLIMVDLYEGLVRAGVARAA